MAIYPQIFDNDKQDLTRKDNQSGILSLLADNNTDRIYGMFDRMTGDDNTGPDKQPIDNKTTQPPALEGEVHSGQEDPMDRVKEARQNLYNTFISNKVKPLTKQLPDRPDIDENRREELQNLIKASALASALSSLADVVGVSTSDEYQPTQSRVGQLGVSSFNRLANMRGNYRNRLDDYRHRVTDIHNYNRQARRNARQHNATLDMKLADTKYNHAVDMAQEMQQEQDDRNDKLYEVGLRLVSQGDEKLAGNFFRAAGLTNDQINTMFQSFTPTSNEQGSTYGDIDPREHNTNLNMMVQALKAESKIKNSEGKDYVNGDPMTESARKLENLKNHLDENFWNPRLRSEAERIISSEKTQDGKKSNKGKNMGLDNPLSADKGHIQSSPGQNNKVKPTNNHIVDRIVKAGTTQQAKQAMDKWIGRMKQQGFSDKDIGNALNQILARRETYGAYQNTQHRPEFAPSHANYQRYKDFINNLDQK